MCALPVWHLLGSVHRDAQLRKNWDLDLMSIGVVGLSHAGGGAREVGCERCTALDGGVRVGGESKGGGAQPDS